MNISWNNHKIILETDNSKIEVKEKNRIIMTGAVAKVCYGTGFCVLKKDDV